MGIRRRTFLGAAAASLAAPAISRAAGASVLKFVPQADITILDPIWTTAYVTRNHGFMVFDTLYGTDATFNATPQMVEGHVVENGGRQWTMKLRDGLKWHDGERVLAKDCVASIRRWGARDAFGGTVLAFSEEIAAVDDNTIRFRLKQPFPLLPAALGKAGSNMCPMMPERLAKTDPFKQITEMVGSGPFRWNAKERVVGSLAVYEKNTDYVPRKDGTPSGTAGPKIVHYDRVEWHIIPDAATKTAAMQSGEMDWWENPPADNAQVLALDKKLITRILDPTGLMGCMRLNHLVAPFDNPAVRRVVLDAVTQADFMIAVAGDNPKLHHVPTGIFTPGTPYASDVGLGRFTAKKDYAKLKSELEKAGYKGEKVVVLTPTDLAELKAEAEVCADLFRKIGLNVDAQASDWGTVVQRRASQKPVAEGGWSVFNTFWTGLDQLNPAGHVFLRGQGKPGGQPGWPSSPAIEKLRDEWLAAADMKSQKELAVKLQEQAFVDVPYIPLGQFFQNTSYKNSVASVLDGIPTFWNVRPA
jgi:peptide/nickel transport system substrate-binding protein